MRYSTVFIGHCSQQEPSTQKTQNSHFVAFVTLTTISTWKKTKRLQNDSKSKNLSPTEQKTMNRNEQGPVPKSRPPPLNNQRKNVTPLHNPKEEGHAPSQPKGRTSRPLTTQRKKVTSPLRLVPSVRDHDQKADARCVQDIIVHKEVCTDATAAPSVG